MGRNSAFRTLGIGIAALPWLAGVAVAQLVLGLELGDAAQRVEERIERQLESAPACPAAQPPPRSREVAPIEPWELVSV